MKSIKVQHSGASYDVLVGDIADSLDRIAVIGGGRRMPLISDLRVFSLYGSRLAGTALPDPILISEGEQAKSWDVLTFVIDRLAEIGVTRRTPILALGGGSVGDVAGLAASLFKRGCPIIHVPTTLLAQADSAVGGKTAIDAAGQKNLVGTFHHPALVVADPTLLDTLDQRQLRSGYAEVVKYGLIDDPSFFAWCENNGAALIGRDIDSRGHAIEHCIRAKVRFVSVDPDDSVGRRALLNLGHSFGHAIEVAGGGSVLHGEAVAVGMVMSFQFSGRLGHCSGDDVARVQNHLAGVGLPTCISDVGLQRHADDLLKLMARDKKADSSGIALILVHGIGQAFVARGVDADQLGAFLRDLG